MAKLYTATQNEVLLKERELSEWTIFRNGQETQVPQPTWNANASTWVVKNSKYSDDSLSDDEVGGYAENSTEIEWYGTKTEIVDDYGTTEEVEVHYIATRQPLPGYVLGSQNNTPLADANHKHSYEELTDKPTLPTVPRYTSQLYNDGDGTSRFATISKVDEFNKFIGDFVVTKVRDDEDDEDEPISYHLTNRVNVSGDIFITPEDKSVGDSPIYVVLVGDDEWKLAKRNELNQVVMSEETFKGSDSYTIYFEDDAWEVTGQCDPLASMTQLRQKYEIPLTGIPKEDLEFTPWKILRDDEDVTNQVNNGPVWFNDAIYGWAWDVSGCYISGEHSNDEYVSSNKGETALSWTCEENDEPFDTHTYIATRRSIIPAKTSELENDSGFITSSYLPYPSDWPINTTTKAFCDAISEDDTAITGRAYIGEVSFTDLPDQVGNGELVVEIVEHGANPADKVMVLTLTSGNSAPYRWQYTYWDCATQDGWVNIGQQKQADWNQTTTTADDFIKNKPTIPTTPADIGAASVADATLNGRESWTFSGDTEEGVVYEVRYDYEYDGEILWALYANGGLLSTGDANESATEEEFGYDEDKVITATRTALPGYILGTLDGINADKLLPKDIEVVHNTGDETVSGIKTFNDNVLAKSSVQIDNDITATKHGLIGKEVDFSTGGLENFAVGHGHKFYGKESFAVHDGNKVGVKGWYFKAIDTTRLATDNEVVIYLTTTQPVPDQNCRPINVTDGNAAYRSAHPEYDIPYVGLKAQSQHQELFSEEEGIGLNGTQLAGQVISVVNIIHDKFQRSFRVKSVDAGGSVITAEPIKTLSANCYHRWHRKEVASNKTVTSNDNEYVVFFPDFDQSKLTGSNWVTSTSFGCTALGDGNIVMGYNSFAAGKSNRAEGNQSIALGFKNQAIGMASVALGSQAIADGHNAFVWNFNSSVNGEYHSHGEKTFNINTADGINGVYIGDTTLKQAIIANGGTQTLFMNAVNGTATQAELCTMMVAVYKALGFTAS